MPDSGTITPNLVALPFYETDPRMGVRALNGLKDWLRAEGGYVQWQVCQRERSKPQRQDEAALEVHHDAPPGDRRHVFGDRTRVAHAMVRQSAEAMLVALRRFALHKTTYSKRCAVEAGLALVFQSFNATMLFNY